MVSEVVNAKFPTIAHLHRLIPFLQSEAEGR